MAKGDPKKPFRRGARPGTGRQKNADLLRFYGEIVRDMKEGVALVSARTLRIIFTNPEFNRLMGYRDGELIGRHISVVNAPSEKGPEKTAKEIRDSLIKNGNWRGDIKNLRKDGSIIWGHAAITTFEHPKFGTICLSIHQDITGRKKSEEELRFRAALLDNAHDGIHVLDTDGKIIYCNETLCRQTGYTRGELLGRNISMLTTGGGPPFARPLKKGAFKSGPPFARFEVTVRRKDGTSFPAEVLAKAIALNGKRIILAIGRDISERKRMETALKDSETNFRNIFDSALDGLLLADAETGRFLMCNKRICELLGYSERELLRLAVKDIHPAKALAHVREQFDRQVRGEIELAPGLPVKRKDGSVFYADVNSAPIAFSGRKCLMGNFRDITGRKKSEEALRSSLEALAEQKKLLEQKNIAFQEVIKSIELEKNAIKDNIARNVSELIIPTLKRLKLAGASRKYLDLLQKNLAALTASFGREITEKARRLTPREIEICNMIKEGLTSKEIADLLGASSQTVDKHRKNIRRKLGLNARKSNLVSYLRSLQ